MDNGGVTVVIPTFNRADLIHRSLRSALEQTCQPREIIVVDDASTDKTAAVVGEISDSRVKLLRHTTNKGPSATRNTGINSAAGEFIAFLDSDDEWQFDKIERQLEEFAREPTVGMVYCGWSWIRSDGTTRVSRIPNSSTGMISGSPRWFYNMVQDVMVRREVIMGCLFDERIWAYENLEWLLRIMHRTRSAYIPEVLVRCHEHSAHRASDSRKTKLAGLDFILANYMRNLEGYPEELFRLRLAAGALSLKERDAGALEHLSAAVKLRPLSTRTWGRLVRAWLLQATHS